MGSGGVGARSLKAQGWRSWSWRSGSTGVCFNIRREFSTWAGSGERGESCVMEARPFSHHLQFALRPTTNSI